MDAESLVVKAKSDEIKAELKKVYEAIRYSDPMSNDALTDIETQIKLKFNALSKAVISSNAEETETMAEDLLVLVNDRNKKCKLLK